MRPRENHYVRFGSLQNASGLLCLSTWCDNLASAWCRQALGAAMVDGVRERVPALNAVLSRALQAPHAVTRAAAVGVIERYCEGNTEGQLLLAATVMPVGNAAHAVPVDQRAFGAMVAEALLDRTRQTDAAATARAALVLAAVLKDNPQGKERLLHTPLEEGARSRADFLLPRCARVLRAAAEEQKMEGGGGDDDDDGRLLRCAMLRLLLVWVDGCPAAVAQLLEPPALLPLLVELAAGGGVGMVAVDKSNQKADVHVAGLAALTLGACVTFNEGSGQMDGAAVVDVVVERVGLYRVFAAIDRLVEHPAFSAAAAAAPPVPLQPSRADGGDRTGAAAAAAAAPEAVEAALAVALYPHDFAKWVAAFMGEVQRAMVTLYARPKQVWPWPLCAFECCRRAFESQVRRVGTAACWECDYHTRTTC
jgi:hypothetical protein